MKETSCITEIFRNSHYIEHNIRAPCHRIEQDEPRISLSETITGGSKSKTSLWDLNQRRYGRTLITCQLQLHQLLKTCGWVCEKKNEDQNFDDPESWREALNCVQKKRKTLFQILSHEPFNHNSLFKRRNHFGIIPKTLTCHYNSPHSLFFSFLFLIIVHSSYINLCFIKVFSSMSVMYFGTPHSLS